MESKELRKMIKPFFKGFAEEQGFIFQTPKTMVRINQDILQVIGFEKPGGFYCNIAIQPLYIAEEVIVLNFGNRINHFKVNLPGIYGESSDVEEVKKDFTEIKNLLETNAIPWFNEVRNPQGIVSFLENLPNEQHMVMLDPFMRKERLAYSCLYLHNYEKALKYFEEILEMLNNDNSYNMRIFLSLINNINAIKEMIREHPEKIDGLLQDNIQYTRSKLKLKI